MAYEGSADLHLDLFDVLLTLGVIELALQCRQLIRMVSIFHEGYVNF